MEAAREPGESIAVLIAEDSRVQAEELRTILDRAGMAVTVARDGGQALAQAREAPPDLVISDIVMPEMDGYDLCRALKADPATAVVPVMLLTALSDPGEIIRALDCGADSFMTKPYDAGKLLSRIDFIQANRRLRQDGTTSTGLEVFFGGARHHLSLPTGRTQVLDLLLGAYETAVDTNARLVEANQELQEALERIRRLEGILTACSHCGRVRSDAGAWQVIEDYVREHGLQISHSLCPECVHKHYPKYAERILGGAETEEEPT